MNIFCNECGSDITEDGVCMLCHFGDPIPGGKPIKNPPKDDHSNGFDDGLNDRPVSSLTSKYLCGYEEGKRRRLNA